MYLPGFFRTVRLRSVLKMLFKRRKKRNAFNAVYLSRYKRQNCFNFKQYSVSSILKPERECFPLFVPILYCVPSWRFLTFTNAYRSWRWHEFNEGFRPFYDQKCSEVVIKLLDGKERWLVGDVGCSGMVNSRGSWTSWFF